jgi:hypothetical protein
MTAQPSLKPRAFLERMSLPSISPPMSRQPSTPLQQQPTSPLRVPPRLRSSDPPTYPCCCPLPRACSLHL